MLGCNVILLCGYSAYKSNAGQNPAPFVLHLRLDGSVLVSWSILTSSTRCDEVELAVLCVPALRYWETIRIQLGDGQTASYPELSGSTLVQADIGGCEAPGHSGPIGYLNRQLDRDLA